MKQPQRLTSAHQACGVEVLDADKQRQWRYAKRAMGAYWLRLKNTRFPLRVGETLAGRSPYCTVVLNDPRVSREHAALKLSGDGLWVEDLDSRNGTRVNGEPISGAYQLTAGDTVEIGNCKLEVQVADADRTQASDTLTPGPPESFVKDEIVTQRDVDIISEAASRISEQSGEAVAEQLRNAILQFSEQLQRSPETRNQGAQLAATVQALQRRGVS